MRNLIISVAVLLVVLSGSYVFLNSESSILGANIGLGQANATSSVLVNTTATLIMAQNTGANVRYLSNLGTSTVFLFFRTSSSSLATSSGYALFPSSTLEMTDPKGNLWLGSIWGVSAVQGPVVAGSQL